MHILHLGCPDSREQIDSLVERIRQNEPLYHRMTSPQIEPANDEYRLIVGLDDEAVNCAVVYYERLIEKRDLIPSFLEEHGWPGIERTMVDVPTRFYFFAAYIQSIGSLKDGGALPLLEQLHNKERIEFFFGLLQGDLKYLLSKRLNRTFLTLALRYSIHEYDGERCMIVRE